MVIQILPVFISPGGMQMFSWGSGWVVFLSPGRGGAVLLEVLAVLPVFLGVFCCLNV